MGNIYSLERIAAEKYNDNNDIIISAYYGLRGSFRPSSCLAPGRELKKYPYTAHYYIFGES